MGSLDVNSLFTNIPPEKTTDICTEKFFEIVPFSYILTYFEHIFT